MTDTKKTEKRKLDDDTEADEPERKSARVDVKEWLSDIVAKHVRNAWTAEKTPKWVIDAFLGHASKTTADAWTALEAAMDSLDLKAANDRLHCEATRRFAERDAKAEANRLEARARYEAEHVEERKREEKRAAALATFAEVIRRRIKGTDPLLVFHRQDIDVIACAVMHITEEKATSPFHMMLSELNVRDTRTISFRLSSPCALTAANLAYMHVRPDAKLEDLPDKTSARYEEYVTLDRLGTKRGANVVYSTMIMPNINALMHLEVHVEATDVPSDFFAL